VTADVKRDAVSHHPTRHAAQGQGPLLAFLKEGPLDHQIDEITGEIPGADRRVQFLGTRFQSVERTGVRAQQNSGSETFEDGGGDHEIDATYGNDG
jgi:hypothetical protein